jgi:hypothetical protein
MSEHEVPRSATTDGLTVSPSLDLVTEAAAVPPERTSINARTLQLCGLAVILGVFAAILAQILVGLINFVTNFAFFGRFSLVNRDPADAVKLLGGFAIGIPVVGPTCSNRRARRWAFTSPSAASWARWPYS